MGIENKEFIPARGRGVRGRERREEWKGEWGERKGKGGKGG